MPPDRSVWPPGWSAEAWRRLGERPRVSKRRVSGPWACRCTPSAGPAREEPARSPGSRSGSRIEMDARAHSGEDPQGDGIELEHHIVDHRARGPEPLADHLGDPGAERVPSDPVEADIGALALVRPQRVVLSDLRHHQPPAGSVDLRHPQEAGLRWPTRAGPGGLPQ